MMDERSQMASTQEFDLRTLGGIADAFDAVGKRIQSLEARLNNAPAGASGVPDSHAQALKHIYDWAQKFGMPPLPSREPKPEPVKVPPTVQPAGFDPFAPAAEATGQGNGEAMAR
jgi:hypothetical protein